MAWETEDPTGRKPRDIRPEHAGAEAEGPPRTATLTERLLTLTDDTDLVANIKLEIKMWITATDLSSALSEEKARLLLVQLVDEP